jgi:hypothetical protein
MMLLDLICFDCITEQIKKGIPNTNPSEPIMVPYEAVNNTGVYTVRCNKGHSSKTVIDNIDFEILFEYGINAIADGYYREAVSSITSSMERYFEFFIKTILYASNNEFPMIDKIWKNISSHSERQLGAYIIVYSQCFGEEPNLLNANKEVPFRNSVVHKGYIPTREEAITYGNQVMQIIEKSLIKLKQKFPDQTFKVYDYYGYHRIADEQMKKIEKETGIEQNFACVNIMTTLDVKHGREINDEDGRKGTIEERIPSILNRRKPRPQILIKKIPREK